MEGDKKPRVSNLTKKILWAVVAVAAAAALFFAGYYTYYLSLGDGFRSLLWVKNMIQDEYYREISDDDFWQAAIDGAIAGLDQYSAYYTDEEYDTVTDENLGLRAGIGVSFFAGSNKISKVAIGSPVFFAQQNTDLAGAWVTGVGGSESEIADTFTSAALAKEMAKYGEGDTVVVRVSEKGANDKDTATCRTLSVVSTAYHESYVLYAGRTDDGQARAFAVIYGEDGEGAWTDVSAYTAADDSMIKTATMPSAEKNAAACPASTSTRPAGMSGHAPCLSNSRPPRNVNAAFTSTGPNSSRPAKNAVRPSAPS